jgi:CheY-like chemotaxis protein/HPt (histidine-containing phosphotransfer) domain-containing protein
MLHRIGYRTILAENGRVAIEHFLKYDVAAVLLDCQMPEMDGFEAASVLRKIEASGTLAHTPIIALTAHATPDDEWRCRHVGMDGFLAKPVKADAIRGVLADFLDRRGADERGRPAPTIVSSSPADVPVEVRTPRLADMPLRQQPLLPPTAEQIAAGKADGARAREHPLAPPSAAEGETTSTSRPPGAGPLPPGESDHDAGGRLDASPPAIAWARLREIAGDDALFEASLLEMFLDGVAGRRARLDDAIAAGDNELIARQAHGIRGLAGDVGATSLRDATLALERSAKAGTGATDVAAFQDVVDAIERATLEVRHRLETIT